MVREIRRWRQHDAITGLQASQHLDSIAIGPTEPYGTALDGVAAHDEREGIGANGLDRRPRHERYRSVCHPMPWLSCVPFAKERHLDGHVRQNAWVEFLSREPTP